jgi:hypothetical protein
MLLAGLGGALALTPACVIPLSPEFEENPNLPPFAVNVSPAIGSALSEGQKQEFAVTIEDPNPKDKLYVRWIIDYPPLDQGSTRLQAFEALEPSPGGINRHTLPTFTPSCLLNMITPSRTLHQLQLAVADRPFLGEKDVATLLPDQQLTATPAGARVLTVAWTFEKDCGSTGTP